MPADTYEKQHQDTISIYVADKWGSEQSFLITRYSSGLTNMNPRFGTIGGIVYQTLVDDAWRIVVENWSFPQVITGTKPALLMIPYPTVRVVEDWLVFYESDSIEGNREIYASGLPAFDNVANISNLSGDDFNPHCSLLYFDSVAVFWEHEVEGGREIWWAKDSLHIQAGSVDQNHVIPSLFSVSKAYPNPFNGIIKIDYSVVSQVEINIRIIDLAGKMISQSLIKGNAGKHSYSWDGTNSDGLMVESGVYIINFSDTFVSQSKKIVLLK